MTTADLFLKLSVGANKVTVLDRTGRPIFTCVAQDGFKAVKRLRAFVDTVLTERATCASDSSTSPRTTTVTSPE